MSRQCELHLIVAMAEDGGIGLDGDMPWKRALPADLHHFKHTTMGHPIIMGRRTFESFPKGALPGRTNIVITRNKAYSKEGVVVVHSLEEALEVAGQESSTAFVIGGGQLYHEALEKNLVAVMHITQVHYRWSDADTFFPKIDIDKWRMVASERHQPDDRNLYPYSFTRFERVSA